MAASPLSASTRSFSRDLTLGLSITVLAVVALAVLLGYLWSSQRSQAILNAEADEMAEQMALTLSEPLWEIDFEQVEQIGRLFSSRPNVLHLEIFNEDGERLFVGASHPLEGSHADTTNTVYRNQPIRFGGSTIGSFELVLTHANLATQQRQFIGTVVLFALMVTATTLLVLLTLVRRLLLGPLRMLARSIHHLAEGSYHHQVPPFKTREMDEIGAAFNQMAYAIADRDQALLEANNTLEAKVEERTQTLQATNTALDAKNEALARKNAEMERFTYTVSHDLKSPLITIKGFLGLIEHSIQAQDTEQLAKDIQHVFRAADHMHSLLDDLLQLSRVGRLVAPPKAVPLSEVIEQGLLMLEGPIQEAGAVVHTPADLPIAWGDAGRLREVFQNLIENGLKFSQPGLPPVITIAAYPEGDLIHCVVQDNGQGIPLAYQETIFGLFERLHPDTPGTGVGLALVKRIVELHHGRIWVVSTGDNEGTAFHFTLPVPPN